MFLLAHSIHVRAIVETPTSSVFTELCGYHINNGVTNL